MAIGWLPGRVSFPGHTLTLIVKGTFRLSPGKAAELLDEPPPLCGDLHFDDDPEASLRYESDFAYFKPYADRLLVGTCHVPGSEAQPVCRVVFGVEGWQRSLLVSGPRHWQRAVGGALMTAPQPFRQLALRYEHAFGGPGFEDNPVGKGLAPVTDSEGHSVMPLAHVEAPDRMQTSPNQRPPPAGFGPLSRGWRPRSRKAGTYDERWLRNRWPWLAEDLDWTFFNAAPPEQQLPGYLRGDESLHFENLRPDTPVYQARLPGLRVRGFVERNARSLDGKPGFEEVTMHLDTLWVDMDDERLVLVWRGVTPVASEEFEDLDHFYVFTEPMTEPPCSAREAEQRMRVALAPPVEEAAPAPEPMDVDAEVARAEAEYEEELRKQGGHSLVADQGKDRDEALRDLYRQHLIDIGEDPARADDWQPPEDESERLQREIEAEYGIDSDEPALDRETCLQRVAQGQTLVDADLSGLDLSETVLAGVDFSGALLIGTDLSGSDLSGAVFADANLAEATLVMTNLRTANLARADLSGSRLIGSDLSGATLDGALLEKADLRRVRMPGVSARRANFTAADLSQAWLMRGHFEEADFSACLLDDTQLVGAVFCGAHLEGIDGRSADFTETDLSRANFGEGCRLSGARFIRASGDESIWDSAELRACDFSGSRLRMADFGEADLRDANLAHCDLAQARLIKARLERASLPRANLFQGSLEKARLQGADLRGTNLYEVEVREAVLEGADLRDANLKMSKLA